MWVMDWSKWKEGDDYPVGLPLWKYRGEPIGKVSSVTDCCGGIIVNVDMTDYKKPKKKEKKSMFGRKARLIRKLEDDYAELTIQYENALTQRDKFKDYGEQQHQEAIKLASEVRDLKFLVSAKDSQSRYLESFIDYLNRKINSLEKANCNLANTILSYIRK